MDRPHLDLAPEVAVQLYLQWPTPYLYTIVDVGLRWVGGGPLSLRVGEDSTRRQPCGCPVYVVDIPLPATLAWQATERVALTAGGSLGTLQLPYLRLYRPAWEEPNGALGLQVAPATDFDVEGVVGLRGWDTDQAFLVVELGVAVSFRW